MKEIVYKFDISKENKNFLDHGLELYNYSKNKWLNPSIYKAKQKCFGFYAYDNDKIVGGAYGFMDDGYWLFIDLLFVEEKYRNNDIATNLMKKIEKFAKAINSKLKKSIVIKSAEEVDERFHSRYSVKSKTYRYIINNSDNGTAIYRGLEYHIPMKLDVKKMQEAMKFFEGEHDFKGFKASGTSSKSSVRTIYKGEVKQEGERIIIEVTGNGFLYNMVRIIAGTLVDVGLEKIKPEGIPEIIESKDRTKAGKTLPPHGLYLLKVEY